MIETVDAAIGIGGSLAGILAASLYAFYRSRNNAASELKKVEIVKIGAALKMRLEELDSQCISYAAVQGIVIEQGKTFKTENSPMEGVILQTSLVEHKSKRTNGVWSDVKKVLMENLESVPFALSDPDSPGHLMMVTEPTDANRLLDDLEVTHHEFAPRQTSVLESGLDRLFGEVCRGYEKSEKMLAVGTGLLGIGEIILEDGKLKLRPPHTDGLKYYLTTMSKTQLVKLFRTQAMMLKVVSIIFGIVASGMVTYALWRVTKRYLDRQRSQRELEEIRQNTLRCRTRSNVNGDSAEEDQCVVCLDNPREVVTLDCGHISMCSDCAQALPEPRCPVCRVPIQRFLPVYRP
ncbi:mitochondrial ubiquitin ligase activator of NFKB 1-like [Babylonia areolata]|uniref:mitochondrial ubiquitin ligase activator of NFKB 1-like n=1 Tax=Babylonia areolata TaxID=304850 RepID=UPI003FD0FE6F